jgi:hypothetical protein
VRSMDEVMDAALVRSPLRPLGRDRGHGGLGLTLS